jgi:hypothetical protein
MKIIKQKSFLFDLLFIIITGGLWNIWMQYRQIRDFNNLINQDKYSFIKWAILTLITFGLYHVYHEYKLTKDICLTNNIPEKETIAIVAALISITGLWIFVDLYQQEQINQIIQENYRKII